MCIRIQGWLSPGVPTAPPFGLVIGHIPTLIGCGPELFLLISSALSCSASWVTHVYTFQQSFPEAICLQEPIRVPYFLSTFPDIKT